MVNKITVKFINETEFATMRGNWNRLLSQSNNNSVFLTHEWVYNWWQTFKEKKTFYSIAGYDDHDSLVGIAPLYIEKRPYFKFLPMRTIKFLGMNNVDPDYLGFIVKSDYSDVVVSHILRFLLENQKAWDIMWLGDMPDNNETNFLSRIIQDKHGLPLHVDNGRCLSISLPNRFEDYMSGFKRKHRYNLNRQVRLLKENFDCEFGKAKSEQEAVSVMQILFNLHQARADEKKRSSAFESNLVKKFQFCLISELFNQGIIELFYIKLKSKIECCLYSFIYNNRFYFYQAGFNPAFSKFSLGSAIVLDTIRYSIEFGCQYYDFLKGEESYKYSWTKNEQKTITFLVCSKKLKAKIYYLMIKMRRKGGMIFRRLLNRDSSW